MDERPAIGARLREARLRQGLEIGACAEATRIRERYLVAIEDGRYESLPDPAYVNGFIRAYAAYLGVPVAGPVKSLPVDGGSAAPPPRPRPNLSATRATAREVGGRRRGRRILIAILLVVLVVLALWIAGVELPSVG
jgi:cytoskeletal protein RodZ